MINGNKTISLSNKMLYIKCLGMNEMKALVVQ